MNPDAPCLRSSLSHWLLFFPFQVTRKFLRSTVSGREEEGLIVIRHLSLNDVAVSETHPLRVLSASLPPLRERHGEDSLGIVRPHFDRAAMCPCNLVRDVKSETEATIAFALLIRAPA